MPNESVEGTGATQRHCLTPLRVLRAVAPSGGEITLIKYTESDRELSWYQGKLSEQEEGQFWSAKLKAERPGIEKWEQATELLVKTGWQIEP